MTTTQPATEPTPSNDTTTTTPETPTEKPKRAYRRRGPNRIRYGRRELQVLRMVSQGIKYDQIAADMGISIDTVKGHLKRVYRKLGAKSGPHAVSIAIGRGMLQAEPYVITITTAPVVEAFRGPQ